MGTEEVFTRVQLSCWKAYWGVDWPGLGPHHPKISTGGQGEFQVVRDHNRSLSSQIGWMVGDGATTNDVAVRTVCRELDPARKRLIPKQVRVL